MEDACVAAWPPEWAQLSREEVIERIEIKAAELLDGISVGRLPSLQVLKRESTAVQFDASLGRLVHNKDTRLVKAQNRQSGRKYTGIWLILQTAHTLLIENKTATQRDVYYLHPFFRAQQEADEAILDAGSMLGVPRGSLNIVGATKGCFAGAISVQRDGQWQYCGDGGEISITQQLLALKPHEIQSSALCIVVVEKDGIFNRLREDRFYDIVPCVLVTGRGFPDLSTREFVLLLQRALGIPVLGLCDCNPYGLSVMLTYKLGSARMPLETAQHVVDMKWIGLRPSQLTSLQLPDVAFKPFNQKDLSVARGFSKASFIQSESKYKDEVNYWLEPATQRKVELEALYLLGFGFLSSFLQGCIMKDDYF